MLRAWFKISWKDHIFTIYSMFELQYWETHFFMCKLLSHILLELLMKTSCEVRAAQSMHCIVKVIYSIIGITLLKFEHSDPCSVSFC